MSNTSTPGILTQKAPMSTGSPGSTSGNTSYSSMINPTPVTMQITKYQFRQLFTMQEKMQLDNALLLTNLTQDQRMAIVSLDKDLMSADVISLGSPDITQAVGFIVQVGILTPQRASMILANLPPTTI